MTGPASAGEALEAAVERLRSSGSESPRLDAELLLGHVLGVERTVVLAHPEAPVGEGPRQRLEALLQRRAAGEPVAYIRGLKEFHGIALAVDERALIPRPETELLVDLALSRTRQVLTAAPRPAGTRPYQVWDVGTGSGAIAVVLGLRLRRLGYAADVRLHLSDVSSDALALAKENAASHGVADLMTFAKGDLLATPPPPGIADLVLANLPYVPSATIPELPRAARFEPRLALDGGADGLGLIRRLLVGLPARLAPGGQALLEIGAGQGEALAEAVARTLPGWSLALHPDLAGVPRVARLDPDEPERRP
jgi:release factor glutamine methyltransferase